ncbi:hypothetical protein BpHYR1_028933 [Brachionus plicatilis]|uniref:Uncharacterized protein n=1 Tax=Brachionus plicatilis TaxID=10195 RepID=A0A3M7PKB7_BRAPC|nr:hypothetical protein BpHYR1_028933 [Brachionus plicatilis]
MYKLVLNFTEKPRAGLACYVTSWSHIINHSYFEPFSYNFLSYIFVQQILSLNLQKHIESQCSLAELDGRLRHRIFEILSMQQTNFPHVQKDFTEQFRIKIRENFPQNPNETIGFYRSADNRKFLEKKVF